MTTDTNISKDGLDVEQIAALVREANPVCLLPWRNEGNAARNDCTLYVYQTQGMDAGRYTTDILSVIESFVPDIDLFTEQDVEKLLFEGAPIRARHDVLDAAVWRKAAPAQTSDQKKRRK